MVQSVELLLDDTAEAAIRRQWRMLADAGLSSQQPHHRPHVTLSVASEIWPRIEKQLREVDFVPFPIDVGAVTVFGGKRPVLVRSVIASDNLLGLHRRVHDVLAECPGTAANLSPGHWTPHVTLARRLQPDQLGEAIRAVLRERDIAATAVGLRRWDGERRAEWSIT